LAVKTVATILSVAALLLVCALMMGMAGVHYPRIIRDEPLQHPQTVVRIEGTNLVLESGAIIAFDGIEAASISNKLQQSEFAVDIDGAQGEALAIWARQDGWVCGTPWAQPIRIPLIRDTTYKNRRQMIAVGSYVRSGGQQDGSADGSRPIRSETNTTSSAAGSRR
jgi:hypothetical protein